MPVPDDIKENVRAVLLSKTDGKGILVCAFPKDYKSIIHKPLLYRDLGFNSLEMFLKSIPDVCRLEYSEQEMAFKVFGIAKPNTFVSSFVKKAEGNSPSISPQKGSSSQKAERIRPSQDLNEKWEPGSRGLYSLCFPNKKGNGLETKEAVAMKFAQVGEVVEIHTIPRLTFVRYRDEKAAKKAVELFGGQLGLKRADERAVKSGSGGRSSGRNKEQVQNNAYSSDMDSPSDTAYTNGSVDKHSVTDINENDEDWDDYTGGGGGYVPKVIPGGGNVGRNQLRVNRTSEQMSPVSQQHSPIQLGEKSGDRRRGKQGDTGSTCTSPQVVQVYIGNWPHEAQEADLKKLIQPYEYTGARIIVSKDSKLKQYAFVDFESSKEAQRIIADLNERVFKGRNLQVRLGKKPHKSSGGRAEDVEVHKGDIEQEFEKLAIHKSPRAKKEPEMPPLENFNQSYDRMPPLESADGKDEMPPLEPLVSPMMPQLEIMTSDEQRSTTSQSSQEPIQLNIGNFPYGTSEKDLMMVFRDYGALSVTMMNNTNTGRSTYAFVDFPDLNSATFALEELDQSLFRGRRLVATLANPSVLSKPQQVNQLANITCTVGGYYGRQSTWNSERQVSVQDTSLPQLSPISGDSQYSRGPPQCDDYYQMGSRQYHNSGSRQMDSRHYHESGSYQMDAGQYHDPDSHQMGSRQYYGSGSHQIDARQHHDPGSHQMGFRQYYESGSHQMEDGQYHDSGSRQMGSRQYNDSGSHQMDSRQYYDPGSRQTDPRQYQDPESRQRPWQHQDPEQAFERSLRRNRSDFNYQRLTLLLQEYLKLASKLRAEEHFHSTYGMTMKVMITHVENEKFFWGQILEDSETGVNRLLQQLQEMAEDLQSCPKTDNSHGLGRCLTRYQNEWFRAWCTYTTEKNGEPMGQVIFIDYGNTEFTPRAEMFKAHPRIWGLPPMARPFKLIDPYYELDKMCNKVVFLEVVEPFTNRSNFVTTVKASWN